MHNNRNFNNKTNATRWRLCLGLLLPFLLSACGGGSSGTTPDTKAPTVSTTTPASNATDVARYTTLTATFDEDIFATTVDAASFTLAKTGAGNTPASVSFDGATNVASLNSDNPLAILANYTAILTTAITDLSGNALAADHSWSFTTAEGAWGTASLIETDNAGHAGSQQIAFDGNGNALAVWVQHDGTNIMANRFNGTSWGTAELIETDNAEDAYNPQIAFDSSGHALAVWRQYDGNRYNLWANHFNGTSWGTAELIEADNAGDAAGSQIAFDSSGNALAVWYQSDGSRDNVWANRFNGTSWGTAELIETDSAGSARRPQIAFDSSGNALAVWYQRNGAHNNIWANRFNGSSWGTTELIETDNAGSAYNPQIAFDSNGHALAVWYQDDGSRNNIRANRFNGTSWGTAELIETDNAGSAYNPQIAFDSNGNALAAWVQNDGTRNNIWVNRFNGSSWGTAELIETDNAGNAGSPQIAVDSSGNALAVWVQNDGPRYNIWVNRFNGSSWGTAELIETDNAGSAYNPQIAFDSTGNALAVWDQSDGARYNIWANRFE